MMYVQQVNKEVAAARRRRFDRLRSDVKAGHLPPLPLEMFRVHDVTFLLPDTPHPDEGCWSRDHAVRTKYARELSAIAEELYDIYDRRDAGSELPEAVFYYAEQFIRENGDCAAVLSAVLDEVERRVQIPQEDQAKA